MVGRAVAQLVAEGIMAAVEAIECEGARITRGTKCAARSHRARKGRWRGACYGIHASHRYREIVLRERESPINMTFVLEFARHCLEFLRSH